MFTPLEMGAVGMTEVEAIAVHGQHCIEVSHRPCFKDSSRIQGFLSCSAGPEIVVFFFFFFFLLVNL